MKRFLVMLGLSLMLCFAGCGKMDEANQASNTKDSLVIMRTVGGAEAFTQKKIITEGDIIDEVRDVFEEVEWQEEDLEEDRPQPDYRIETYDLWVPDQASQIEAKDIESEKYARFSEEQSAIIIHLIIDAFH